MNKRIKAILRCSMIEQSRNIGTLFSSYTITIIFYIVSLIIFKLSKISENAKNFIITSQFFSGTLLIIISAYAITNIVISIVEKKENETFILLKQTELKPQEFILGTIFSSVIIFNLNLILIISIYLFLIEIRIVNILKIFLMANLSLLTLIPFAFILGSKIKKISSANAVTIIFMLFAMMSLTFSTQFGTLLGGDINTIIKFLFWNPLIYFYDTLLVATNAKETLTFINFTMTVLFSLIYSSLLFFMASKYSKFMD